MIDTTEKAVVKVGPSKSFFPTDFPLDAKRPTPVSTKPLPIRIMFCGDTHTVDIRIIGEDNRSNSFKRALEVMAELEEFFGKQGFLYEVQQRKVPPNFERMTDALIINLQKNE